MSKLPPVTFATFVQSLAGSAMAHMGLDPRFEAEKDLDLARHSIDVLALMQEKTDGNLDAEEKKLLDTLVAELKVKFVEAGGTS